MPLKTVKIDTSAIWKYLRMVDRGSISTTNSLPDELEVDGEHFSDSQSIAAKPNHYFSSVAKVSNSANTEETELDLTKLTAFVNSKVPENTLFSIPYIRTEQVSVLINSLDPSKATGLDGIGPKIIKLAVNIVSPIIAKLINKSINSGSFPDQIKVAKVYPIFKGG